VKRALLKSEGVLVSDHRIGFSGASRPVGEDGGVEAVEYGLDEGMGGFEINLNEEMLTFSFVWLR
jgi:hypothetical protein